MTTTQTPIETLEVVAILIADGWTPTWPACTNSVTDEYGNTAALHLTTDAMQVEFTYALGGPVEILHLNPAHGVNRISRVISTLADAPEL